MPVAQSSTHGRQSRSVSLAGASGSAADTRRRRSPASSCTERSRCAFRAREAPHRPRPPRTDDPRQRIATTLRTPTSRAKQHSPARPARRFVLVPSRPFAVVGGDDRIQAKGRAVGRGPQCRAAWTVSASVWVNDRDEAPYWTEWARLARVCLGLKPGGQACNATAGAGTSSRALGSIRPSSANAPRRSAAPLGSARSSHAAAHASHAPARHARSRVRARRAAAARAAVTCSASSAAGGGRRAQAGGVRIQPCGRQRGRQGAESERLGAGPRAPLVERVAGGPDHPGEVRPQPLARLVAEDVVVVAGISRHHGACGARPVRMALTGRCATHSIAQRPRAGVA